MEDMFPLVYDELRRIAARAMRGERPEALGISPATVKRDWTLARAWLNRELQP
jgi:hypothetical protein